MERLLAILGAVVMVGIAYLISTDRKSVKWKVVLWGMGLQWSFGLLFLKVPQGRKALAAVAGAVTKVLSMAYEGSTFVFGQMGAQGGGESSLGFIFAFQVLPAIVFVSALFAVLYYLGVMQFIVGAIAKIVVRIMGASGAEATALAAAVFMGQTEAPLTIRPFLNKLTQSELFVVMVSGMATVSGAILGAYVDVGRGAVEMEDLLTAVAMTAPACLMLAKVVIPETGKPQTAGEVDMSQSEEEKLDVNLLSAIARGTTDGLKLAVNVGAMLIAFIALIALINAGVNLIVLGGEPLSLERILGWVFAPFAALMGVPWNEATEVGSLLGTRLVANEMVAYGQLSAMSDLGVRSKAIATVAICGFANLSSIGIQIGGLGALAPERKQDIARLGIKALAVATLANFSSACVTGALL